VARLYQRLVRKSFGGTLAARSIKRYLL